MKCSAEPRLHARLNHTHAKGLPLSSAAPHKALAGKADAPGAVPGLGREGAVPVPGERGPAVSEAAWARGRWSPEHVDATPPRLDCDLHECAKCPRIYTALGSHEKGATVLFLSVLLPKCGPNLSDCGQRQRLEVVDEKHPIVPLALANLLSWLMCVEFLRLGLEITAPSHIWSRMSQKDKGKQMASTP